MLGRNGKACWGVSGMRESRLWGRCVWGEYGGCGEVCCDVKKCMGRCGKEWGNPHFLLRFPHTLHIHPTPLPTLTSHLPTLSLTSLHPSPFPAPLFPTHLTPPPTLPTPPPTLPHTHHALSFTPYQNFSLFSFLTKLV